MKIGNNCSNWNVWRAQAIKIKFEIPSGKIQKYFGKKKKSYRKHTEE